MPNIEVLKMILCSGITISTVERASPRLLDVTDVSLRHLTIAQAHQHY